MFRSLSVIPRGFLQLTALVMAFQLGHALPALAQAASASISGTIADAQGGVLPGVTITVQNAESGTVRTGVTEADGKYRVAGLNPGRYNLTAELPGFQTIAVKDIVLVVGQGQWEDTTGALHSTRSFASLLDSKGLRCELDVWGHDVPHDWPSWRAQLAHHLPRFV